MDLRLPQSVCVPVGAINNDSVIVAFQGFAARCCLICRALAGRKFELDLFSFCVDALAATLAVPLAQELIYGSVGDF